MQSLFKLGIVEKEKDYHIADFRHLVQGGGWESLSLSIKQRFNAMAECSGIFHYTGHMVVQRSRLGLFFSYICKLFGSPLVSNQSEQARVNVAVFKKDDGICWQRSFCFDNKLPITVSSLKVVDSKHGMMERVGGGLHMKLRVYEEGGNLHFVSNKYCIKIGQFYIPLPSLFTPGKLHVAHIDEGGDKFRFRMTFTHKYFGRTFYQDGVFEKTGDQ